MLKQQLHKKDNVDVAEYITNYASNIKNQKEGSYFMDIVFNGQTRAKYLPFDYNWSILPSYEIVVQALIRLSGTVTELKRHEWRDPAVIYLVNHVSYIFGLLKDGLIAFGCKRPPKRVELTTTSDTILEMAQQVVNMKGPDNLSEYFDNQCSFADSA